MGASPVGITKSKYLRIPKVASLVTKLVALRGHNFGVEATFDGRYYQTAEIREQSIPRNLLHKANATTNWRFGLKIQKDVR